MCWFIIFTWDFIFLCVFRCNADDSFRFGLRRLRFHDARLGVNFWCFHFELMTGEYVFFFLQMTTTLLASFCERIISFLRCLVRSAGAACVAAAACAITATWLCECYTINWNERLMFAVFFWCDATTLSTHFRCKQVDSAGRRLEVRQNRGESVARPQSPFWDLVPKTEGTFFFQKYTVNPTWDNECNLTDYCRKQSFFFLSFVKKDRSK